MAAKDEARAGAGRSSAGSGRKPLLMVDIDGVISLFGFPAGLPWEATGRWETRGVDEESPARGPAGSIHTIDGVPHYLSNAAAVHLVELAQEFELVWASGWEEKADEYLPHLLGLPRGLPHLRFERDGMVRTTNAHWKLGAIEAHAGSRPLAWIDDSFDEECHMWARRRDAPTLLVQTIAERGLTNKEAGLLREWAQALAAGPRA
jgi:hypothetical protein